MGYTRKITSRWILLMKEIKQRDNNKCIKCGSSTKLEIDHIMPFALAPELQFEPKNLQTLCRPCHINKTKIDRVLIKSHGGSKINNEQAAKIYSLGIVFSYYLNDTEKKRFENWCEKNGRIAGSTAVRQALAKAGMI